jgi:putative intracellular protease/amidase
VCHAPVVFKQTKGVDGKSLVSGRRVTGFTNTEEAGVGLTKIVPFLVEDMLKANGGQSQALTTKNSPRKARKRSKKTQSIMIITPSILIEY